jgi:hypothetical protein
VAVRLAERIADHAVAGRPQQHVFELLVITPLNLLSISAVFHKEFANTIKTAEFGENGCNHAGVDT